LDKANDHLDHTLNELEDGFEFVDFMDVLIEYFLYRIKKLLIALSIVKLKVVFLLLESLLNNMI